MRGSAPLSPYAYFQLTARHEAAGGARAGARLRRSSVRPSIPNRGKYQKVEFGDIDKLAADPSRKLPYTEDRRQRLGGNGRALFRRGVDAVRREKITARVLREKLDNGLYSAGVIVPVGTIAPGAAGEVRVPLYVGPQDQEVAGKDRQGPGSRRRLRHLHRPRRAAFLAAQMAARHPRQLGLGDHRDDDHDQERVLPAQSRERRARWRR